MRSLLDGAHRTGARACAVAAALALSAGCASKPAPAPERACGTVEAIPAAMARRMLEVGSYHPSCPVGPNELLVVRVPHWSRPGVHARGTLVVHARRAWDVADAFCELFQARFVVSSIRPIEEYGGSDERSRAANNTSAFNCRTSAGSAGQLSQHAYGTAVDVNPLVNPYARPRDLADWDKLMAKDPSLGVTPATLLGYCALDPRRCLVLPPAGAAFIDRAATGDPVLDAGLLVRDGPGVRAFVKRGFRWGGNWPQKAGDEVRVDLQHFEKPL